MEKIRTAVVGLGMGLQHVYAYQESEKADLRYVVDLDEERAAQVAKEVGCDYATDWTTIIDEVDAISICTPHHLHAPQALQAIAKGKHVLIEKPLGNTEQECLDVIQAAEEKDVTLMLAYVVRYWPSVKILQEELKSGKYGKPINASCRVEAFLEPVPGTWFARKEQLGGGVLFSHGCHYIDLIISLFGEPTQVAAFGSHVGTEWMEGEGTSQSIMKFENGAVANLLASWGLKYKDNPTLLQVHTTDAVFVLKGLKLEVITAEGRKVLYDPETEKQPKSTTFWEIEHFLDSIATGKTPETDGHDAMKSHRAIWKMYEFEQKLE